MAAYRIHFIDHGNRVFGTDHFHADSDPAAVDHARTYYSTGIGKGHEIWRGDEHIHTEIYRPWRYPV